MLRAAIGIVLLLSACVGNVGDGDDDDLGPGADASADGDGAPLGPDAGVDPADYDVDIPLDADRPVDIIDGDRLAHLAEVMPPVLDPWLRGVLESPDTMWYDHQSIVPGYQDSFGDNVIAPIGMRPNTISPSLIDTAVPGGHAQIFESRGVFHFPFGRPGGFGDEAFVIDFWHVPRETGAILPVVWWHREPNGYTHRTEWMFPKDTTLGEVLILTDETGEWYVFEIRTRTRRVDGWTSDLYRPFTRAAQLADALESARQQRPEWATAADIDALIEHARTPSTLSPTTLSSSHFASAFPAMTGHEDALPGLADVSILQHLMRATPFRTIRDEVWKSDGSARAYGPTTNARFHIVPADYNAGVLDLSEQTCDRCHQDAGRPFKDWYDNILAYGELWGEDESFSWHPFENATFVDGAGNVVDFNYDNRTFRADFLDAGLFVPYAPAVHTESNYKKLPGTWKDYAY